MMTKAATFTETAHWSSAQAMWHFKKTVCRLFKDSKLMSVLERSVETCVLQPFKMQYFSLTCAGRCVTCSWIQLNVTWLYRQRAAHVSQWRAVVRGGREVIWVGEVSQRQQAVVLHCGASTAFLNHAVQLQLRGPVKHLTLIWGTRRKHDQNHQQTPCDSVTTLCSLCILYFCSVTLLLGYILVHLFSTHPCSFEVDKVINSLEGPGWILRAFKEKIVAKHVAKQRLRELIPVQFDSHSALIQRWFLLPWPTSGISVIDSVDIFCTAACHNEINVYLCNKNTNLTHYDSNFTNFVSVGTKV